MAIPKSFQWLHAKEKNMLDFHADDIMLYFNCHHFGTVQSFNAANQTASATIDYQKLQYVYDAQSGLNQPQLVAYPPLTQCPVFFHCGINGGITFPLSVGDKCDIFFNDRDMDAWFAGAVNQAPATARLHDFSDAIIVVGTRQPASPLSNFSTTYAMLRSGDGTAFVGVNKSNGKISIQNSNGNLETILQSLVSALESLTVNTGTGIPNPPFVTNITAVGTNLAKVLE